MNDVAPPRLPEPGRNCFRIETAERLSVIVDAEDYFRIARAAMLKARRRITLVGWDFDGRISLDPGASDGGPDKLGAFVLWLVERNPELEIFLLRWDVGALATLARGTTFLTLLRWMRHPRIHTKLDGAHPPGSSHHQKIVVIDDGLAFCGGIDMTGDRWDTREHAADDERRRRPTTHRPYKPWHDATTAITGPVTATIAEICRERWAVAGGTPDLTPLDGVEAAWPDGLDAQFRDMPLAVSRSAPPVQGRAPVREIEALYLDQIARARRFLYAESQYFASRRIAEAVARRLEEPGGPEIVVINPLTAQGWLEPVAMDTARARLVEALRRRDREGRFRLYHPFNAGGEPIYVHAKVLVADDRILRVGSSNMNNRSLRLDTECDVTVDLDLCGDNSASRTIAAVRNDLLAEHLGTRPETVAAHLDQTGSLIATIEALRGSGRSLRPYEVPDLSSVEAWLADNEVLDPEGPEEMFEPLSRRGLFRGFGRRPRP
ncbi:phospholipase D-like domain-containing protein [Aureimonas jatrophae]|uniref:Phospholipase D n=1 Tax=Aureimonas jatrophae TaxID=1166073 RepID=A0A1H0HCP3_9HYPH|nr:phospholipase D-like domain-containing protein [Aureimonas jatrophae]MBB3950521.1 phosphatidylserine/phosphatidylglycerophosphate/cardiolipin synthase-like enzyme [Aureimonas jatrophae]SDO16820.1 Phosphatidylserine/phosphatidylglycerophosphate/cardiolipin synthase [Aureimonas jatrophae]